jgi:hypothetical protein
MGRTLRGFDEDDPFGGQIAGGPLLRVAAKVAVVYLLHKPRCGRIAQVVDDDPADSFQPDKTIGAAGNGADGYTLRLRPLLSLRESKLSLSSLFELK